MKPVPLLLFLPLLFPVCALAARPLAKPELRADGRYEFKDKGKLLKFKIASDELQESGVSGTKRTSVSAKAHIREIQADAKRLAKGGRKMELVAYLEDKPQTEANRRTITNRVSVTLNDGVDPALIAEAVGASSIKPVFTVPNDYILTFNEATEAIVSAEALRSQPGVLKAQIILGFQVYPAQLLPVLNPLAANDPLLVGATGGGTFNTFIGSDYSEKSVNIGNPPTFWVTQPSTKAYQWYLNPTPNLIQLPPVYRSNFAINTLPSWIDPDIEDPFLTELLRPAGPPPAPKNGERNFATYFDQSTHLNVIPAWDLVTRQGSPIDGTGVRIGLIDDGAQVDPLHPDIFNQTILTNDDHNYLEGDQSQVGDIKSRNPTPPYANGFASNHGTMSAGIILARRNNNLGMSGIAPDAKLAAYRIVGGFVGDDIFSDSLVYGANRIPPPLNGTPTGNEWRNGTGIKFDVANNGWSLNPFGRDLTALDLYTRKALAYGATEGRLVDGTPRGIIYVVPAGNGGDDHDDTNYSGQTNSMYTVVVGAVSDLGRRVSYSNPGASLHVVAPSTGQEMAPRILVGGSLKPAAYPTPVPTTLVQRALGYTLTPSEWDETLADRRNTQQIVSLNTPVGSASAAPGYFNNYGGTSTSCAMATGVVALMLEINPKLGWRDVQEILMRSATVVDPMMGEYQYNAMGMPMSHKYGAGLIDAYRAVRMAKVWQNLGPRFGPVGSLAGTIDYKEVKGDIKLVSANKLIPDNAPNAPNKIVLTVPVDAPSSGLRVERVVVRLKVTHLRRGDLGVVLSAPRSGQADREVESYLMVPHREDINENIGMPAESNNGTDANVVEGEYWDFSTVRHWGTGSQNQPLNSDNPGGGQWTLTIWDNTNRGVVSTVNLASTNHEDHVIVSKANPAPGRLDYGEVIYHGSNSPSNNEPPVIVTNLMTAQTASPFQATVRATSDVTVDPVDLQPRAPIYDYRVKVINQITGNPVDLVIGPATAAEFSQLYPDPGDPPAYAPIHLRFDRATGQLTNAPYTDGVTAPFKPLPRGSWLVEFQATSIFGSTRRQIPFTVKDSISYLEWKTINFTSAQLLNPAISGDNADPDLDGVPNLLEYNMGGQPFVYEPTLAPTQRVEGNNLIFTYQRDTSTSGFILTPQLSTNMNGDWVETASTVVTSAGTTQIRELSIPIVTGTRQFVRLIARPG